MKMKYFDLAKKLASKSTHKIKLGCVLVKKNRIVSLGFNKKKTHPKSNTPYKYIHAELDTVLGVDKKDLEKCDVYVYRETKDGEPAISKPCYYCQEILRRVDISNVHYTIDKGYKTLKF